MKKINLWIYFQSDFGSSCCDNCIGYGFFGYELFCKKWIQLSGKKFASDNYRVLIAKKIYNSFYIIVNVISLFSSVKSDKYVLREFYYKKKAIGDSLRSRYSGSLETYRNVKIKKCRPCAYFQVFLSVFRVEKSRIFFENPFRCQLKLRRVHHRITMKNQRKKIYQWNFRTKNSQRVILAYLMTMFRHGTCL